jgi:hypothetical protein
MHKYGGVYADLDVELLRPLQPLLELIVQRKGSHAVIGQEPEAHALLLERKPRQACNAFLASEPGHPFWLWLVKRLVRLIGSSEDPNDPVGSTGPRMLETALQEWERVYQARRRPGEGGAAAAASVYVSPPDTLYPLWDGGQANSFKERCEPASPDKGDRRPNWADASEIVGLNLSSRVLATCQRLSVEGFVPTVPASGVAFASHHWAHTWIDGAGFDAAGNGDAAGSPDVEDGLEDASAGSNRSLPDAQTLRALGLLDADLGLGVENQQA